MNSKGYVHKDIKPENIMIKNRKIKIVDFGISLKVEDGVEESEVKLGVINFEVAPPEIFQEMKETKIPIFEIKHG